MGMRFLLFVHTAGTMCLAALIATFAETAFGTVSQEEVLRIVDAQILQCEHDEDATLMEADLRRRGATDDMLAHGYSTVMFKTKDAPKNSVDSAKFQSAVCGFSRIAGIGQLTNLLQIASSTTVDVNSSLAIRCMHLRAPFSRPLLHWCITESCKTNSPEVTSAIWTCLDKTLKVANLPEDIRHDILKCARKGIGGSPLSAFAADRILAEHEPTYRNSALRRQVASRIVALKGVPMTDVVRRHFESLSTVNTGNP